MNHQAEHNFKWTRFYEALADKLLAFKDNRSELIAGIHNIVSQIDGISPLNDTFADGSSGPLQDICPFSTIAIFNRWLDDDKRIAIASKYAEWLNISEPVPDSIREHVIHVDNRAYRFFDHAKNREPYDIDSLWEVFARAIAFAESDNDVTRSAFSTAYDNALNVKQTAYKTLTIGLYWIRPWQFQPLEINSLNYINKKLDIQINKIEAKKTHRASDYLELLDTLKANFQKHDYPVHSFPELAISAWRCSRDDKQHASKNVPDLHVQDSGPEIEPEQAGAATPLEAYSINDIIADGCFIAKEKLINTIKRLRDKKNLILQGPPGTGKTWLAKRLAFALMGQRDDRKVRAVQFHPNLSYEDFIRGWRPEGDGKLALVDGPFMEMIAAARKDPASKHVIVIEEINRGNPVQIFGEMLTLLEADKRTEDEALELSYKRKEGERIFIPDNLYVIGTMNIADRSLALVDLALRRRFAFIDLEPALGDPWCDWVHKKYGIDKETLTKIGKRIADLNTEISNDPSLGAQCRIGHSFVMPPHNDIDDIYDANEWFRQIVETEIRPLLDDHWSDDLNKSKEAYERLLEGF